MYKSLRKLVADTLRDSPIPLSTLDVANKLNADQTAVCFIMTDLMVKYLITNVSFKNEEGRDGVVRSYTTYRWIGKNV